MILRQLILVATIAKLLEEKMGKDLLCARCRHRVDELTLGAAFDHCFSTRSTSPEIIILKKFREDGENFDKLNYESALVDENNVLKTIITKKKKKKEETLKFIKEMKNLDKQPRKDYSE